MLRAEGQNLGMNQKPSFSAEAQSAEFEQATKQESIVPIPGLLGDGQAEHIIDSCLCRN